MGTRWNLLRARDVAQSFAKSCGLDSNGARLVSFRQNALFVFPVPGVTVRIYSPLEDPTRAKLMLECAETLRELNFPAVRPWGGLSAQPLLIQGCTVTAWEWLELDKDARNDKAYPQFGQLLATFHSLDFKPGIKVPAFDPVSKIHRRVERLVANEQFSREHLQILRAAQEEAERAMFSLSNTPLGHGLLHGDALIGNTLQTLDGMKLIDLDSVCEGPREWDFAPSFVAATRFRAGLCRWQAFLAAYGISKVGTAALHAASTIKQLSMTVVLCLRYHESPAVDQEIVHRLEHWSPQDPTIVWHTPERVG